MLNTPRSLTDASILNTTRSSHRVRPHPETTVDTRLTTRSATWGSIILRTLGTATTQPRLPGETINTSPPQQEDPICRPCGALRPPQSALRPKRRGSNLL